MKPLTKTFALSICTTLIVYLLCAFIAWDLNPGNWPGEGRVFAAILIFIASIITATALMEK
jgi:ABC-type Fe3+ transport system permease subunit